MTNLIALTLTLALAAPATQPGSTEEDSMRGKIFVGYQGWFTAGGAGFDEIAWNHWGWDGVFEPGSTTVDMWPDMTDYGESEKYPTDFRHADGSVAHVFSSTNPDTVSRHFGWMREYGIDGAFLQRFGISLSRPNVRPQRQRVLENVRAASAEYGVDYAIMYDLTALSEGMIRDVVIEDWKQLVDAGVRRDEHHLRHEGKPVVAVWGIGFDDGRAYTLRECKELVDFLKNDPIYGGNAVVVGVPYWWRGQHRDATDDPLLIEIIELSDVVLPWSVGRYKDADDAAVKVEEAAKPDLAWLRERGIDYMPVIWPGFSWHNMQQARGTMDNAADFDRIPRAGGRLFWRQGVELSRAGVDMLYVAMFDEVDEATAVFKVSNDPPVGDTFLTLKGDPPDHYLHLTRELGRVLAGEREPTDALPERQPE